jgi:hypothetical protein
MIVFVGLNQKNRQNGNSGYEKADFQMNLCIIDEIVTKNVNLLVLETSSAILNCSNLSCPASLIALCLLPFKISTI